MPSRRAQRIAEAVREVVSMAILAELKDPRIRDVTVTYVEVSGDLRHAKVHVSVMGDEKKQRRSLQGLHSAAGFLQSRCAARIDTRYTPRIQFVLDQGVKKSIQISQILDRVLPHADAEEDAPDVPAAEADSTPAETHPSDRKQPAPSDRNQPAPSELNRAPPEEPAATGDRQEPVP